MFIRTLLATSLPGSLVPLSSPAQTASTPARFYVGGGATLYSNIPFVNLGIAPRLLGPSLTAGWQFTPRWAGQVGLAYHGQRESYPYRFTNSADATALVRSTYFSVPVLLRYTFTAPTARVHFEGLGGATLVHAASHLTYESDGPLDPALQEARNSATRFNLTLGPGVRTALTSHLELTAASLVSLVVGEQYYRIEDKSWKCDGFNPAAANCWAEYLIRNKPGCLLKYVVSL